MTALPWTSQQLEILQKLLDEKTPTKIIVEKIAEQTGTVFSRNAVIGMGWRLRNPKETRVKKTRSPRAKPISLLEVRDGQCRWPLWKYSDEPKFFCGAPTDNLTVSWCPKHCKIVYTMSGFQMWKAKSKFWR